MRIEKGNQYGVRPTDTRPFKPEKPTGLPNVPAPERFDSTTSSLERRLSYLEDRVNTLEKELEYTRRNLQRQIDLRY